MIWLAWINLNNLDASPLPLAPFAFQFAWLLAWRLDNIRIGFVACWLVGLLRFCGLVFGSPGLSVGMSVGSLVSGGYAHIFFEAFAAASVQLMTIAHCLKIGRLWSLCWLVGLLGSCCLVSVLLFFSAKMCAGSLASGCYLVLEVSFVSDAENGNHFRCPKP